MAGDFVALSLAEEGRFYRWRDSQRDYIGQVEAWRELEQCRATLKYYAEQRNYHRAEDCDFHQTVHGQMLHNDAYDIVGLPGSRARAALASTEATNG